MDTQKYCNCGDYLYSHLHICPFCGGIKIRDSDILDFVLNKYKVNYNEIKEEYITNLKEVIE